jgi:hypothetical protein
VDALPASSAASFARSSSGHSSASIKRLVVFRFHKAPLVCRSRVELLRTLNPQVSVHGLFGGSHAALRIVGKKLIGLDGLYASGKSSRWNWQHGDLLLAQWYRDVGSQIPFDIVHLIEWDLLLAAPLESLYASVPDGAVGLTALTPVAELEHEWTWLRRDESRREWEALLDRARAEWRYDGVPYGCLGPGPVFPRRFLEAYAAANPPALCNDELRLPLFAQILGFPLADTRLRGPWRGEREDPFFHFRDREIELSAIRAELAKAQGWRAFHPVRVRIDPEEILR